MISTSKSASLSQQVQLSNSFMIVKNLFLSINDLNGREALMANWDIVQKRIWENWINYFSRIQ